MYAKIGNLVGGRRFLTTDERMGDFQFIHVEHLVMRGHIDGSYIT